MKELSSDQPSSTLTSNYRPEIDGLRALAVLSVIAFHLNPTWLPGGFIGVDIFFVISGFLITAILTRELHSRNFSIRKFYERRARRILPALSLVVAACIPLAWLTMDSSEAREFGMSVLSQFAFSSNFLFWSGSGYFSPAAETMPLLHTWSLAVEEQYYLLLPIALLASWSLFRNRGIAFVVGVALACSLIASQFTQDRPGAFYLLPFRAWELLAGSLAATIAPPRWPKESLASTIASIVGGIAILCSFFWFAEDTLHPSILTVPAIAGTTIVLWLGHQSPTVVSVLGARLLAAIGAMSYSLYLWHWPVIAFARLRFYEVANTDLGRVVMIIVIAAIAYLSWRFVEVPARRHWTWNSLLRRLLVLAGVCLAGGTFMATLPEGSTFPMMTMTPDQKRIYAFAESQLTRTVVYEYGQCFMQGPFISSSVASCTTGAADDRPSGMVWGDSHAAGLISGIRSIGGRWTALTTSDCGPFVGWEHPSVPYCRSNNDLALSAVGERQPDYLLLLANWLDVDELIPLLPRTFREVKLLSPHTKIFVLGSLPQWHPTLPEVLIKRGVQISATATVSIDSDAPKIDHALQETVEANGARFVSLVGLLCVDQLCPAFAHGVNGTLEPFAWDYGHLTGGGSRLVANALSELLGLSAAVNVSETIPQIGK